MADQLTQRKCCCCGFTSTNWRLFIHPNDASRHHFKDKWICRSYWKCVERSRRG